MMARLGQRLCRRSRLARDVQHWDGTQWAARVGPNAVSPSDPLARAEARRRAAAAHSARGWPHDLAVGCASGLAVLWILLFLLRVLSRSVPPPVVLLGLIGAPAAMIALLRPIRSTWLAGGSRQLGIVVTARVLAVLLAAGFGWLVFFFTFLVIGCSHSDSGTC